MGLRVKASATLVRTTIRSRVLGDQQRHGQRVVHRLGDVQPVVAETLDPCRVGDGIGQAEARVHARVDLHVGVPPSPVLCSRPRATMFSALGGQPRLVEALGHPLARPFGLGRERRLAGQGADLLVAAPELPHHVGGERRDGRRELVARASNDSCGTTSTTRPQSRAVSASM